MKNDVQIFGLSIDGDTKVPKTSTFASNIYIDGLLEKKNGFDLCKINQSLLMRMYKSMLDGNDEMYIVNVKLHSGKNVTGLIIPKAFHYAALVVDIDDISAIIRIFKKRDQLPQVREYGHSFKGMNGVYYKSWRERHPRFATLMRRLKRLTQTDSVLGNEYVDTGRVFDVLKRIPVPMFDVNGEKLNEYEFRLLQIMIGDGKIAGNLRVIDSRGNTAILDGDGDLSAPLFGLNISNSLRIRRFRQKDQ